VAEPENGGGESEKPEGLGAFRGVFAPSLLTILGVILFLRLGWVVGQAGLGGSLAIITLASAITLVTGLSISAIATDRQVRGGGAYYMISRSFGAELGGAIGVPLFLSQGLSVALYTMGFAESVVNLYPELAVRTVALVATGGVALLALVSAGAVARVQLAILAVVVLALASIVLGGPVGPPPAPTPVHETAQLGFWAVFAVFFPAVTGIMAGVNLSGDLRSPSRDLPLGTLGAVGAGWAIYCGIAALLAVRASAEVLVGDTLVLQRIARWDALFVAGVWGATLSSAIGSIVGAPRVLQALARDRIVPSGLRWLGRGSGSGDEPRVGVLLTAVLCLAAVATGSFEGVATLLTLFFLTTYAALNLAAGVEGALGNPSYRPRFAVPWPVPIAGGVACIAVMLLLDAVATLVAAVMVLLLAAWLRSRSVRLYWGDLRRGLWTEITRAGLRRLQRDPDLKNWRPHLLVLAGAPTRRPLLVELAEAVSHGRAMLTVAALVAHEKVDEPHLARLERTFREQLEEGGVQGRSRVVQADDRFEGAEALVEAYGLGRVAPDTIVLGHLHEPGERERYCRMLSRFHGLGRHVLVMREDEARGLGEKQRIDVWWGGLGRNGALMLLLAHLIRQEPAWRRATLCVRRVVEGEEAVEPTRRNLETVIERARVAAEVRVIYRADRSVQEVLDDESAGADLVLVGLAPPDDDDFEGFVRAYAQLDERTAEAPTTVYVMAARQPNLAELLIDWEERQAEEER